MLLFGAIAVAVGFLVGSFVGGVNAERETSVVAFGLVTLPTGPLAVGVYAGLLGLVTVSVLFVGVRFASRYDDAEVE